mmetsp:Transcript_18405/g.34740  ORF Transcript_18405/g.34740 Transcript_18405/m.34740 type:complete len:123 (+) Transcript_18405:252-620(+)
MKHAPHLCICPFVPHPGVMRIPGQLQVVIYKALIVHALVAGAQHMEITGLTTKTAVAPANLLLSSSHATARTAMDGMEGSSLSRKMAGTIAQDSRVVIQRRKRFCWDEGLENILDNKDTEAS